MLYRKALQTLFVGLFYYFTPSLMSYLQKYLKPTAWCFAIGSLLLAESARAVLSVSFILLVIVLLYDSYKNRKLLPENQSRAILWCSLGFIALYATQFLYSDNTTYLWERITIKLPLIILPLAALYSKPLNRNQFLVIAAFYVALMSLVSAVMLVRYFINKEAYDLLYAQSSVMPGPISHIRLSIMVAFSAYVAYYMVYKLNVTTYRLLWYAGLILLIIFTHVYSVRSGLFAFYTLVAFEAGVRLFKSKYKIKVISAMLVFAAAGILALVFTPTIRNKLAITIEELKQFNDGRNLNHNSIGKRLASYQIAWEMVKERPLTGCGIGDYHDLNTLAFREKHPEVEVPIIAHNQFLYYLAAAGILGMLFFLWFFFYPLLQVRVMPILFIAQLLVLFVSFQTEPMLETQLGVAYSVLFWLLPLCVNTSETEPQ
jgi:O-antigen ligase